MQTAILIGINNYARPRELPPLLGCKNDVEDMTAYLRGVGVTIGTVLEDATATKQGIMTALRDAIASLRAGDELIVHYSGHGAPFPLHNAVHDAICPFDFDWSAPLAILDVDLGNALAQVPFGARVSIIADSCYSGGLQPSFTALMDLALAPSHTVRTIPIPVEIEAELKAFSGVNVSFGNVASAYDVVLIAACGPKMTAADASFSNRYNGALTHSLLQLLDRSVPPSTAEDLLLVLRGALRPFAQVPELHGREKLFATPFLLPTGVRTMSFGVLENASPVWSTGATNRV